MGVLKNEFSWSRSREELFQECRRKNFFHYYGSWGGWEHESDARTREIYMLKNLKTRAGWAGLVIQEEIQAAARSLSEPENGLFSDHEVFIENVIKAMREEFSSSKRGAYRQNPKSPGLVEHEYNLPVEAAVWKANAEHVKSCLRNFFASDTAARIRDAKPGDFLEFKKFDSVNIRGVKVFATPDLCFRAGDAYILTAPRSSESTPESIRLKIACQILFLTTKNKIALESIQAVDLDLLSGRAQNLEFEESELDQVRERIQNSSDEMKAVLADAASNQAREDDFSVTDSDEPCGYCSFKKVCPKFAASSSLPSPAQTTDAQRAADSAPPAAALKGIKAL